MQASGVNSVTTGMATVQPMKFQHVLSEDNECAGIVYGNKLHQFGKNSIIFMASFNQGNGPSFFSFLLL